MMADDSTRGLSRRDLLKLGTVVGGAAILPAATASVTGPWGTPDSKGSELVARILAAPTAKIADQLPEKAPRPRSKRPNVLLIILDTVRADHLSCYGYERETTPNLTKFAATARKYDDTMSPSGYTLPSHASLFTGLPVSAHGAVYTHQYLDKQSITLAELIQQSGYQTAAWSCNPFFAGSRCGFDRGFETFVGLENAVQMHTQIGKWFTTLYQPDKPFFIFLNYIEAHFPYVTAPDHALKWTDWEVWERWHSNHLDFWLMVRQMVTGTKLLSPEQVSEAEDLYDDAIAYVDAKLGQLFSFLARNGLDENTLVLVTSDHGEQLNENLMMLHGYSLYEPILRVPFIVRCADRFPVGEDHRFVQTHDAFPTILEVAGVPWERKPTHNCHSLLSQEPPNRLGVASELVPLIEEVGRLARMYPQIDCSKAMRTLRAVRSGNMKLLVSSTQEPELYDLQRDFLEIQNLAPKHPEVVQDLARKLDKWLNSFPHYRYVAEAHERVEAQTNLRDFEAGKGLGYIH